MDQKGARRIQDARAARHLGKWPLRPPPRRLLRQGRQYLRRGVGEDGAGVEIDQGGVALTGLLRLCGCCFGRFSGGLRGQVLLLRCRRLSQALVKVHPNPRSQAQRNSQNDDEDATAQRGYCFLRVVRYSTTSTRFFAVRLFCKSAGISEVGCFFMAVISSRGILRMIASAVFTLTSCSVSLTRMPERLVPSSKSSRCVSKLWLMPALG